MSPEKDPIFTAKVISFAFAMLLGLWGILTKRVFDLPKEYVLKKDMENIRKEFRADLKEVKDDVTEGFNRLYDKVDGIKK